MNADRMFNLLGSIVVVATITTVLLRGSEAAAVIIAFGESFSQALGTAMGTR